MRTGARRAGATPWRSHSETMGRVRAVLIDRHGTVIAGSKTVAEAQAQGVGLRVVESDGTELIAVQRRDLDLATDARAQALAVADNRVAELDLAWDEATLRDLHAAGVDFVALLDRRGVRGARRRAPDGPHRRERGRRPRTDRHGAGGSGRAGSAPAALRRRDGGRRGGPRPWRGWPRP